MNGSCSHPCSSEQIYDEIRTTASCNLLINSGLSLRRSRLESSQTENQCRRQRKTEANDPGELVMSFILSDIG